ncbi:hypothetical protein GCM10023114_27430 [Mycolicibacterium sediminis]|uniref:Uncharacterized protein n=2 Tax=Mycolicibacterium sediminis TaxID=1286180 RepID=A0A7I7QIF0_9MYCO|nr:hypothetical protein MSEDJ_01080 [Mycolicibacterium sediminis]
MQKSMDVDYNDKQLNDGLSALVASGGSRPLRDMTSWTWDEVHLFHEGTPGDFIEKTVGEPVIKSKFYGSKASLLVFEDGGKPVKAVGVSGDYLRGADDRVSFPADVVVETSPRGAVQLAVPAS